ncbi:MAG TPA: DUF4147 domain-containing protein [Acidobacteriaceae bacterium]|nr:DUF4147 domain-containing protein [Acidobacteriaceae bacterium]
MTATIPENTAGAGCNQGPRSLHTEAREIFARALEASSIPAAFDSHFHFENGSLIHRIAGQEARRIPLAAYRKVFVIAVGKAALAMLDTLLERAPRLPGLRGICCAPVLPERKHRKIRYFAGGHPSPNRDSFRSARAALRLLGSADKDTFVFFLISGGGSSLFEAPLDKRITFADTIAFHRALVGSGAAIAEINAVRKHFSAVKGGRLAAAAGEAAKFTVLVSDVPAQHLDALASGPTLADRSTVAECLEVIERYRLLDRFPPRVQAFFSDPGLPETPGEKHSREPAPAAGTPQHELHGLGNSELDVLLSNDELLEAARREAEGRGWTVAIDNHCDDWDYRDAAQYLLQRLRQLGRDHPRLCLLSGGEVTVRLSSNPGEGGRNQQFALACAAQLAGEAASEPNASIAILSAGSDGIDGLSPAAGAVADPTTVARAREHGLDAAAALERFDSYPLFHALGDTVVTGPTNNNLRDLRILLSCR